MALETTSSNSMVTRMMRAARLEVPLYEEVEADLTATNQALLVVVLVAVARGIGAGLTGGTPGGLVGGLITGLLSALIGWAVWSYVVYFVGTRFFGGTATYGELLRTLGFAESPSVLLFLSFIPVLGGILAIVVGLWTLVTSFVATRQALDIDNTKTVFTIIIGAIALFIVIAVISVVVGLVLVAAGVR
jgi:hypothetical protein